MYEIMPRIEQLESIANLLNHGTASSARLAVIVADNFAEIIMQDKVRHEFAQDQVFRKFAAAVSFSNLRWPIPKRDKALGGFDSTVNFLTNDLKLLDLDDAEFFKFAHSVRNRAYHADKYHRDTITSIARTYFGKICSLYPKFRFPGVASSRNEREATFLKRHALADSRELMDGALEKICEQLAAPYDCATETLAQDLAHNLSRRIQEILGTQEETGLLDALLDGAGDTDAHKDDMLKRIQFRHDYKRDPSSTNSEKDFSKSIKMWKSQFAKFRANVNVRTLQKWASSATTIARETTTGKASQRFRSIDEQLIRIEGLVHDAVAEREDWVDS